MKIVIPGGTGQVGALLARTFQATGHDVIILSRTSRPAPWRVIPWDAETIGAWASEVDGADVTATIYAHRYDAPNDEATGIIGGSEPDAPPKWRFSIDVAQAWERAAQTASTPHTRTVLLRSAMIMSPDRGGIFDTLLRLVRFGLGGSVGDGRQYVSWLDDQDFVRAILWLIEHDEVDGIINLAAPNPVPYAEFMRTLRDAWGMPIGLPATTWMVEIGTFLLRTESELALKSRRVIPGRLLDAGFTFQYPTWAEAGRDLCQRWRQPETTRAVVRL